MSWSRIVGMCVDGMPSFLRQYQQAKAIEYWVRAKQGSEEGLSEGNGIFVPNPYQQTEEHVDLGTRSYSPWAGLIEDTLAQTMFLDGVKMPGSGDNLAAWEAWQRNGWDAYQGRLYRSALSYGLAYASALPGNDRLTGDAMPKLMGHSAKKMAAFFDEDDEEFPTFAMRCVPYRDENGDFGWNVRVYDETAIYYLSCKGQGWEEKDWTPISFEEHNLGFTPIIRYTNLLDLDGRAVGEIEPVIPILKRIDQDTYDRLIVQRYGAWKVRYITGLVRPKDMSATEYREKMLKMKVGDFLTFDSKDTTVGTLPETQLAGFIAAGDKDLRDLAAVRQMPPHMFTGQAPQMQPESLAAINASLMARSLERRTSFGESHERLFRVCAKIMGNTTEMRAWNMQVVWRDTETRSLAQTADALGKIATQLKVPVEMLWERIEGWTDSDTERAKDLIENGTIDQLIADFQSAGMLNDGQQQPAAV